MKHIVWVAVGLFLAAGLLSACVAGTVVEPAASLPEAPVGSSPPTEAAPPVPAPVTPQSSDPPPTGVAPPASPTPVALSTATESSVATSDLAAAPTVSPTPIPTFTPPPLPPPDPAEHYSLVRPVPAGSSQWTDKAYPYASTRGGTLQVHHGVEFNVPAGTPVLAAADGIVRFAGVDDTETIGPQLNFYGRVIVIEHPEAGGESTPLFTVYGHLSALSVEIGQSVSAGETIGFSGDSGVAYGPHLHFEVRLGENNYSTTRNPLLWLRPFEGLGTVAARITWPDGRPVTEAPVVLRRVDGEAPYTAGATYATGGVNGDDQRQENLVLDDVVPGYYELEAGSGPGSVRQTLWVFPNRTTFLTLTLP